MHSKRFGLFLLLIVFFISAFEGNVAASDAKALASQALEFSSSFDKPIRGNNEKEARRLYDEYRR